MPCWCGGSAQGFRFALVVLGTVHTQYAAYHGSFFARFLSHTYLLDDFLLTISF